MSFEMNHDLYDFLLGKRSRFDKGGIASGVPG